MKRKPLTLRLDPKLYGMLSSLSSIVHRSMNQLVTDAVSIYVMQESKVVERDLENTLQRIREYTKKDPKFEQAIAAFADAETRHEDPVEGTPVSTANKAQSEIRELLGDS